MSRSLRALFLISVVIAPFRSSTAGVATTTFENLGLPPNSYNQNAGPEGVFVIDGNVYNNTYDSTYDYWSGWALSSKEDTTTPGYLNQFSAITGMGAGGSSTYAVAYTFGYPTADAFHPSGSFINLAPGTTPLSIDVTNTTYAYLSMMYGDQFARPFGPGDYLQLTITGFSGPGGAGARIGEVDFHLANFLGSSRFVLDSWWTIELADLAGSESLVFGLRSSDNDPNFGMNTPAYFAIDNFRFETANAAVPEPTSFVLLLGGVAALFGVRRLRAGKSVMLALGLLVAGGGTVRAGIYDPQVGQPGSLGIPKDSPRIVGWAATVISLDRGPQDVSNPNSPLASFGSPDSVVGSGAGDNTFGVVSLGDGGSITLGFDQPIANGQGADFVVFENGFLSGGAGLAFLELAFVDVSSDGINFFRFPSVSLTPTVTQVGGFGLLDASDLHNLAGKHIAGYGTGFDLEDLAGVSPWLDINRIIQVRITDVVGSIDPRYGSRDSLGNLINDPFSTPFGSSGFDFNGIGVIHTAAIPEPSSLALVFVGLGSLIAGSRRRVASRT